MLIREQTVLTAILTEASALSELSSQLAAWVRTVCEINFSFSVSSEIHSYPQSLLSEGRGEVDYIRDGQGNF